MQYIEAILLIISIIIIKFLIFNKNSKKIWKKRIQNGNSPNENSQNENIDNYKNSYQRKYLLTKNEYYEYKKLKEIAEKKELIICPKVRLLDLLEPRTEAKNHKTLLYKIQSKHVDFVICDKNLYVKAILEIDDNSHNQKSREERDIFIDTILQNVGYKVIRTRSINENIFENII